MSNPFNAIDTDRSLLEQCAEDGDGAALGALDCRDLAAKAADERERAVLTTWALRSHARFAERFIRSQSGGLFSEVQP